MTQRLIIYIDETWPVIPSAPWVLLDERNRIVQEGRSEPAHWPAVPHCELVLGGAQCSAFETRIPKAARREQERLLRYALETQLLKDVDAQHLAVTHQRGEGAGLEAGVLVISRARLRTVLARLAEVGRVPLRAVAELQAVPDAGSSWTLALGPTGGGILRVDATHAFVADAGALADILAHALLQARASGAEPDALEVRRAPTAPGSVEPAALAGAVAGLRVEAGSAYRWWETPAGSADLLHGEFAPSQRGSAARQAVRRPLILAAVSVAVFVAVNLAFVLWQRHELDGIEERMRRLFVTAVPDTPAIAPALQLRRHLDEARSLHGELREDDLLALLWAYTEIGGSAAPASVRTLDYEAGQLKLTLDAAAASEVAVLEKRFALLGYVVRSTGDAAPSLMLSRKNQP
ncbi:type II secretion system protein GspL [Aromatoleum buckelii]|uniref:GspL cytoplasmic actin-ATPase-like domain-containing protein n=1 Tax=Aromatoleum buckelii TaxID=200254 RepID=A0ABX1N059_9RHOO|nr:type II secretion system protein GspL [Aromatoleum buckelii]MCK0511162.1 type II secretion system protein GspL [Aromatoleum buckelii]